MENGVGQDKEEKATDRGTDAKVEENPVTLSEKDNPPCATGTNPGAHGAQNENTGGRHEKVTYFIAIHLGAGKHSMKSKSQELYKKLCRDACFQALAILEAGGSADDAVIAATTVLEDSELVNAGTGSELNSERKVECDAGYMSGSGYFGGVGAIPGCPNPILVARKIAQLNFTRDGFIPGAVPPITLTGIAAKEWAASQGIPVCDDDDLISNKALRAHEKVNGLVNEYRNETGRKRRRLSDTNQDEVQDSEDQEDDLAVTVINDTVGAVALDSNGHVAATVSTGGHQLKLPGRIGHVPIFGSGCWAADRPSNCDRASAPAPAIAVSTTGVGEMLVKMQWASECAVCLQSEHHDTPIEAMKYAIEKKFVESPLLRLHSEPKLIGGLALLWDGRRGELVYGFHAQSFIFAYAGGRFNMPEVKILSTSSSAPVNVGGLDF